MKRGSEEAMRKMAEGMGAQLYDMLHRGAQKGMDMAQQGGQHLYDAFTSEPVRRAGEVAGEAVGRVGGALEGMYRHPGGVGPIEDLYDMASRGGQAAQRAFLNEGRAAQGAALGREYAPHVAGGAAAIGTALLLKKLLGGSEPPPNQYEVHPDRDQYPNYY